MVAFHSVGGVDQAADLLWKFEESRQVLPVVLPRAYSRTILVVPGLCQLNQVGFGFFTGGRLINGFQISDKSLTIFPDHVFQALPDLVDHAALHLGFRKNGLDGILETGQAIDCGDEHIFYTAVL